MSTKPLIDGIQVLRGVAALLVVIRHGTKEFEQFSFEVGQFGVDIFFVISGFVIYLTSQNIDWKSFARKRFLRIAPLYWLITLVTLVSAIALGKDETKELLTHAIYSVLFIPHGNLFPTLYVGWTLNYEMWFYLLFGSLIFLKLPLLKSSTIAILAAIALGLFLLGANSWQVEALTVPLLPIIIEFLAGIWLAHLYTKGQSLTVWNCALFFFIALMWLYLAPAASAYTIWRPLAWGVPAILIVAAVLGLEKMVSFRKFSFGMLIGNASYALYLIHPLVIRAVMILESKLFPSYASPLFMLCLLILLSLVAGIYLHLLVEKKLLVYFNK